ncbi:MAG: hypothetical protein EON48_06600 [Acetobacteraceae bacterium]|nr:MAG: hypothetical protein EON48_06600 [Acetobacteraceae bacterium]
MLHNLFHWMQWELGKAKGDDAAISWSQAVHESLNFWGLLEGTHLITVGLFFGTIMMVDLRVLGLMFKQTPVSKISDKTLPLTVVAFATLVVTGLLLFFAKPEEYYHNLNFRLKMVFILLAMINIAVFHTRVQKNQAEWDLGPAPAAAKLSVAFSLLLWIAVICCGRFIAYNWVDCGKPMSGFLNWAQECSTSELGATTLQGVNNKTGAQ